MSDEVVAGKDVIEDPEVLRAANQKLTAQCVVLEDALRNRDLADFADVLTDETRPFWTEQFVANRTNAIAVLTAMRGKLAAAVAAPGGSSEPRPLHNRATARVEPPAFVGGTVKDGAIPARIRNRAHEISKVEGVPFTEAFRRAEREIVEK
jgi:hypothetical protein